MEELFKAAKEVLVANAKSRCLREWDHANDPPCHPSDADWNGCYTCVHRAGVAATLYAAANYIVHAQSAHMLYAIADELEGK